MIVFEHCLNFSVHKFDKINDKSLKHKWSRFGGVHSFFLPQRTLVSAEAIMIWIPKDSPDENKIFLATLQQNKI